MSFITQTKEYIDRRSKRFVLISGFVVVLGLGVLDSLTGPELSFSIFYVLPVSLVSWYVSRFAGIVISIVSAVIWLFADWVWTLPHGNPIVPYWDAMVKLSFYLAVTYAISAHRISLLRRRELAEFIVHDLRSPLTNVLSGLQLLQYEQSEPEDQKMVIDLGISSGHRILTLIDSLLDLDRLESGQITIDKRPVDIEALVRTSVEQVSMWANQKRVSIVFKPEVQSKVVSADYSLTERVIVNLLSNAIKLSKPQSEIMIEVSSPRPNGVSFCISDEGPGIPAEWTDKVFGKYAQVQSRGVVGRVGSGLGLTFCKLAIETQGGQIWMESNVGKGTKVKFTLPG